MSTLVHEEQLRKIFQNVNDWLKFAEAKNAGLLTFDLALLFGINKLYGTNQTLYAIAVIFIIISMLLVFITISPILNKIYSCEKSMNPEKINIHFYGHLKDLDITSFIAAYNTKTNDHIEYTRFEEELIDQILINSRITWIKYKYFTYSIYALMTGLVISLIYCLQMIANK